MSGTETAWARRRAWSAISANDSRPTSGRPRSEADAPKPVMYTASNPACSIRRADSASYAPGATTGSRPAGSPLSLRGPSTGLLYRHTLEKRNPRSAAPEDDRRARLVREPGRRCLEGRRSGADPLRDDPHRGRETIGARDGEHEIEPARIRQPQQRERGPQAGARPESFELDGATPGGVVALAAAAYD